MKGLDLSFSGVKTSFLYFIREQVQKDPEFIVNNLDDICASIQYTIIEILMKRVEAAAKQAGICEIAIAGGVSANSGLRAALEKKSKTNNWKIHIPKFEYCTDNAAMIAMTGYLKYLKKDFTGQEVSAMARYAI
jgi:N6-L-threonylcarbamoyladenine synthase